jgi:kynurenine formamidase
MSRRISRAELGTYFDRLSNWGRWGQDDELGTLNLLTPERRMAGTQLVKRGLSISLAREISPTHAVDNPAPMLHHMLTSGEGAVEGFRGMTDWFAVACHGFAVTHVDSLNHIAWDGTIFNGRSAEVVTTQRGGAFGSVGVGAGKMMGRGVLLDVPRARGVDWLDLGDAVYVEDLERCEQLTGCDVGSGDILLIRTGRDARTRDVGPWDFWSEGTPGLDASCLPWLRERDIAVLVCDTAQDVMPSGYDDIPTPVHTVGIVAMGLWLLDNAYLEELAAECFRSSVWEFLFACEPLLLKNSTGSPVTPVAVF